MRLFLDANVLYSAASSPNGRSSALFRLAAIGRCTLSASGHVVEEARRNIALKSPDRVGEFDRLATRLDRVAEAPPKLVTWAAEHDLSANDAPVLASAVSGRADFLVTGDRTNFGELFLQQVGGVTVASLRETLSRVIEATDR